LTSAFSERIELLDAQQINIVDPALLPLIMRS